MQTFTFSDGKSYKGIVTSARINREEFRDVLILRCNRNDATVMAEYDRSLRLNEALLRLFTERHPDLSEAERIATYNSWTPSAEDLEEAEFCVNSRVYLTNGFRDVVNGSPVYFSARLTQKMSGAPVFVPYTPKEAKVEKEQQVVTADRSARPVMPAVAYEDSF